MVFIAEEIFRVNFDREKKCAGRRGVLAIMALIALGTVPTCLTEGDSQ